MVIFHALFNTNVSNIVLFDMDGVLCEEPIKDNDDSLYADNIKVLKPLYIPKYPILGICTARLEKHRETTEKWLEQNNVQYKYLIMCNRTYEERKKEEKGYMKALTMIKLDALIFVESSLMQAKRIKQLTLRNVFCVENMSWL